jgi:hypothetical protein
MRVARRLGLVAGLLVLAMAGPAQAADQPVEAPAEFRNGQQTSFGSVAMDAYLQAGKDTASVEARFVLDDLEAIERAANVLFAFNLKGDAADVELTSITTPDGKTLTPVRTQTVDDGRQPQAHVAPADLLAAAQDGQVEVVLKGLVTVHANGQFHLGAMVIAFDEGWGIVQLDDGPAQLYGFSMVMATGLGGGAMPFQGQGNTWVVLPVALLAFVVAVAGVASARSLMGRPVPSVPLPPPVTTLPRTDPKPSVVVARPAAAAGQGPADAATSVPVFGGPAPKPTPLPRPVAAVPPAPLARHSQPSQPIQPPQPLAPPSAPLQGPLLPAHPLDRSPGLLTDAPVPAVAPRPPAVRPVHQAVKRPKVTRPVAVARPATKASPRTPARGQRPAPASAPPAGKAIVRVGRQASR